MSVAISAWNASVTWVASGGMVLPSAAVPGPLVGAPVSVIQIGRSGVP